jgi:hypothetical protein
MLCPQKTKWPIQAKSKMRLSVTEFPRNWWPTKVKQRTEVLNDSALVRSDRRSGVAACCLLVATFIRVWPLGCVLHGTPSILRIHGLRNYHLAECQCCTLLCTVCTVASPVLRVSTSEVSIEIMGPVSDNGDTRPGPYFRCGRCSAEGFCCCHGHSCVTIVGHSQYAHCLQSSTEQSSVFAVH